MKKKILLILSALVCGTLAFAQTYTGNLHVSVEGSESDVKDSQVTVAWDEDNKSQLDFTLHDFAISIGDVNLELGDITIKQVDVTEGTNEATISCTDDHEVEFSDDVIGILASNPTVTMTGTISEDKLYADMTISVTVLGSTYNITATFASSGDDDLNGSYMIVNTETEQFLYGSYNWGCRASLGSKPVFWTVTSTGENTYTLSTQQWTDTRYMYLSGDFYCDTSTSTNITVTETETGSGIYTISSGTNYMLQEGKNAGTTTTTDASQASHFKFVSLQDVIADMANASSSNPVDVTALIDDANFKPNGNGLTAKNNWTDSGINHGNYSSNATQACCAEGYNEASFSTKQSITLPKKGIYILSAQGFYRNGSDGNGSNEVSATMYAGSATMDLPARRTSANTMAAAWDVFLQGSEPIDPITIEAQSDDETVEIGFTGAVPNYSWAIFGELTLLYYGETLDYAIGEPECSVTSVTPGSEVSITFPNCITPDETETPVLASGKSITVNGTAVTATLTYSGTTATVTFTVPETIARGTTVTVLVPAGLVEWSGQSVSSPAEAVTFYLTTPIEDQTGVYLFNLGENEFLSRGHNNDNTTGTAADVDVYGLPVDITANADGKYNIRYIDSNLYLGGMYWATANEALASAASFTLVEDGTTDDGKIIYRFRNGSSNSSVTGDLYVNNGTSHGPLGLNDDDNGVNSDADRQWVIYSKEERDALKAANVLAAKLATAKAWDPSFSGTTDSEFNTFIETLKSEVCTSKVGGASLATADDLGYWTEDDYYKDGDGFAAGSGVIETYNDVDDIYQTITGLEEGIYKVTLQGFNRMGAASYILENLADYDISLATLGANNDEINLKTWASDRGQMSGETDYDASYPSKMEHAAECFTAGLYNNELYTYVGEGGSLTITIACPDFLGADWVIFTNMTLTRYYTEDPYVYDVTKMLANPSFEEDAPTGDFTDTTHGAYAVTSLTGWTLTAPTGGYAVCDLMTKDATATDNNFGVPGEPTDSTYMLYLRNSHLSYSGTGASASVMQDVTLPAGKYKLAVDSKCVSSGSAGTVSLVAGEGSTALAIHSTSNGTEETKNNQFPDAWDTATLKFTLTDETKVTLGVNIAYNTSNDVALSILLDNFRLYSETDVVEWTLGAEYGTLILPFAADLTDTGLTAYTAASVSSDELSLTDAESPLSANTPYIMTGTAGTYYFTGKPVNTTTTGTDNYLIGLLPSVETDALGYKYTEPTTTAVSSGNYVLQDQGEGAAFYLVAEEGDAITCGAYHCYLDGDAVPANAKAVRLVFDDVATAIEAVEATEETGSETIYDLSGRRVAKAQKGVYIVNGKKMVIK